MTRPLYLSILTDWWRDRRFRLGRWGLVLMIAISVFADFLATDVPLYIRTAEGPDFPAFRAFFARVGLATWTLEDAAIPWKTLEADRIVFAPVPYSAKSTDLSNANFVEPFGPQDVSRARFRHLLGTDHLGRDVLAGLIHGTRVALLVGMCSMLLAALLGIPLGAAAGFLGDDRFSLHLSQIIILTGVILLIFYFIIIAIVATEHTARLAILLAGMGMVAGIGLWFIATRYFPGRQVTIPFDSLVLRALEILRSIPAFFFLFAILGMIRSPHLGYVILLIAILFSPSIIRFVRAEALKLRDQTYVQSAKVLGLTQYRIIARHIIPNASGPAFITIAFGMGTAVLIESALSFLGIGVAPETVTWGKMLNLARGNFSAWWIAILPGLAIFCTIALFNRLGDVLESRISGRKS